jgi:hypothetical protein
VRRDGDVRREPDHHEPHRQREPVHRPPGLAHEEQSDGEERAQRGAPIHRQPERRVEPEPRAGDVADVEREPAERDEHGERPAEAGRDGVGHVLRRAAAHRDDAPDGELGAEVEHDGDEDREAEARPELLREDRGLRQKPGPDGRRRHEERGADERGE